MAARQMMVGKAGGIVTRFLVAHEWPENKSLSTPVISVDTESMPIYDNLKTVLSGKSGGKWRHPFYVIQTQLWS